MSLTFTILGCGSSMGVPRVGSGLGRLRSEQSEEPPAALLACWSSAPSARGRRTRVLVDCTPDLRMQLLDAEVDWLDGVLFTHEHADHTHGIDDLRAAIREQAPPRRRLGSTSRPPQSMHARFGYCFATPPGSEYPPILTEHRLVPGQP